MRKVHLNDLKALIPLESTNDVCLRENSIYANDRDLQNKPYTPFSFHQHFIYDHKNVEKDQFREPILTSFSCNF